MYSKFQKQLRPFFLEEVELDEVIKLKQLDAQEVIVINFVSLAGSS